MMLDLYQRPETARIWMSALQQVAICNGPLASMEERMLASIAKHLRVDVPLGRAVSEAEIASSCRGREAGTTLLRLALLVTLSDKQLGDPVLEELDRIRRATGADDPVIPMLEQIYAGKVYPLVLKLRKRHLKVGLTHARTPALRFDFITGALRKLAGIRTYRPEVAQRYRRLGFLPPGTFGRVLWESMRARDLDFPGEGNGLPDSVFYHDCSHILADYDTSSLGEVLHACFIAGYCKVDSFTMVLSAILQHYYGLPIVPFAATSTELFEPERMLDEYQRGRRCKVDMSEGMHVLWPYMAEPLEEVRRKFGIEPRTDRVASWSLAEVPAPQAAPQPSAAAGSNGHSASTVVGPRPVAGPAPT